MAGFRQPEVPRSQLVLWSERLEDALPADHPVRQLDFLLRCAAFASLFREWENDYVLLEGQPPYHPRDLAALHLYGLLNRLRSSRQLEAACWNRLDVIWLMSGQRPDHATIAAFVTRHAARLRGLKKVVLEAGIRAGLVKLDHTAVDGTNIEANAGRGSVQRLESIERQVARLDELIAAFEVEWEANERREAGLFGAEAPWAPPREGSPAQRMQRLTRQQETLRQALAVIERRRQEAAQAGSSAPQAIAVLSDPDSRVMRDKEGRRKPNYNAQLAVDADSGMILAEQVNDRAEDSGQLTPMLAQVQENCGRLPKEASADSQYNTGPELAQLETRGVTGLLPEVHTRDGQKSRAGQRDAPAAAECAALEALQRGETLADEQWSALPRDGQNYITKEAFVFDAARDEYRCPAGQSLPLLRRRYDASRGGPVLRRQYRGVACADCPHAAACCRNPRRGRIVNRDEYEDHRVRMRARMATPEARQRYALRKRTVEPRIGYLKQQLGVRRFLHRGLAKVSTEWTLVCTAINVGVLLRCWTEVRAVL
jgi:transposase